MLLLILWSCWETFSNATENGDLATEINSSLTEYTGSHCMVKNQHNIWRTSLNHLNKESPLISKNLRSVAVLNEEVFMMTHLLFLPPSLFQANLKIRY